MQPKKKSRRGPDRAELLDGMERAELRLWGMVGRWQDSLPALVRAELMEIALPLLRLLLRAGRR